MKNYYVMKKLTLTLLLVLATTIGAMPCLGEAKMLGETMGEPPLILLDDVMSELDSIRRDYILNSIGDSQIFLTCCDKELFSGLSDGKVFIMEKGRIEGI